jgi:hypothetical protein
MRLPEVARACVAALGVQLRMLKTQILQFDRMIMAWHRSNEVSKRLDKLPAWVCVPKTRFCNIGDEGHQEQESM